MGKYIQAFMASDIPTAQPVTSGMLMMGSAITMTTTAVPFCYTALQPKEPVQSLQR